MTQNKIMESLKAPFKPEDIEWKVQTATENNGQISVLVVPYLDARAIMDRFDEVCGVYWKSEFKQMTLETAKGTKQGFSCMLSVKIEDEWITRVDGAEVSDIESIKGGHSNALKRAAVQWGIGRYLYELPTFWVKLTNNGNESVYGEYKINGQKKRIKGRYDAPRLDKKFLPEGYTYPSGNQRREQPQQQNQQNASNQNAGNGNGKQQTNNNNQNKNTPSGKPSDQAAKTPLEHTVSLLSNLKVGNELVPGLFNKVVGKRITVGQASEDELRAVVKALMPVQKYLEYCEKNGLTEEEMLYYAQITTREKLNNHMNLFLKMDSVILTETTKLIHEDRIAAQTA